LKGEFALTAGNDAGAEQGIHYFEDAIKLDPTFAPAYMGMAKAYDDLGLVFSGGHPAETRPKVMSYARQALALDPDLVGAHVVLGNVLQQEWHWTEAETEYRRALELNPNDSNGQARYALWLSCQGRTDEAVDMTLRARALDPVGISGDVVSRILFHAHRYEDAIRESRSAVALQPESALNLTSLGFALLADNKPGEAVPVLVHAHALSPGSPATIGVLIMAYARAGRRDDAMRLLAELSRRRKTGYVPAAAFVNAYLGLGDKEKAFYWLEQAFHEQSNILQFVKTHPFFDPIRDDPRFADLVRRVGLG
jgi:tetratricopeptide (TPR) repeat protein